MYWKVFVSRVGEGESEREGGDWERELAAEEYREASFWKYGETLKTSEDVLRKGTEAALWV